MALYNDALTKRQRYESTMAGLRTDRSTFEAHWDELASWVQPRRIRRWAGDRNKGDKRNQNIIDSTPRFAVRTLQSGLHAGLTSPARPWMKLTTPDPDLAKHQPVREWLHETTQRMLTVLQQTNIYNVLPTIYGDFGLFGTCAMAIEDDTKDLFRARAFPIGSYLLGMDKRGVCSTFARDYEMTVGQVVEEFGVMENGRDIDWSKLSRTVKSLWDKSDYSAAVKVTWIVQPNEAADRSQLAAKYLPFSSCHYETGDADRQFLRESGYRMFPVMAPRWEITGEDTYGTDCPGMTALGDVKQLQMAHRRKGQGIAKMVDPALVGPSSLRTQKTSLLPGDVTYSDTREGMAGLRAIHEVTLNLEHLARDIGEVQYRIQRAFYEDLFLMLARADQMRGAQPITAREVEERHEEKLLALGPVLERTNDELLEPMVDRVYDMMEQAGLIPPAPPELKGVKLDVEYTSIMAQAQKLVGVVGQDRLVQTLMPMVEVFGPGVIDKIDLNQLVDNYGDMLGIDPRVIISNEDADAKAQGRAQQQQAAQDAENAKNMGAAIKSAGTTPMGEDTALQRVLGGQA